VRRAIREHMRDFIAIAALFVLGLASMFVIFLQQGASLPSWVPGVGEDRFELRGEFSTAQAVIPGQGQTVNIAGIRVGDVSEVELDGGAAVVTMQVEERYVPLIHDDATMLLRPRTGLQDMTVELDPGTESAEPVAEGATVELAQTAPNVQPDEILATLDGDTRAYLQLLLQAGGEGLGGRGKQLSAGLRRFEPLARDLRRIGSALAVRRENIARAITSLRLVSEELGRSDTRLAEFVVSSDEVLGSFADQEAAIRAALSELPGTLRATREALAGGEDFAEVLGPASRDLIPAARALGPGLREVRPFLRDTVEPIRDSIRPFTRAVRRPVRHTKQAAGPLGDLTEALGNGLGELNQLTNALAYNPPGAAEEGFLFWLAWLNHNGNALFFSQDAHGPMLRGVVTFGCNTASLAEGVAAPRPFLRTLQQITNVPQSDDPRVCPQ
jgi:phospholipid/cholesterol/gamma-HCH transport system substrate-binding protein